MYKYGKNLQIKTEFRQEMVNLWRGLSKARRAYRGQSPTTKCIK